MDHGVVRVAQCSPRNCMIGIFELWCNSPDCSHLTLEVLEIFTSPADPPPLPRGVNVITWSLQLQIR